MTQEDLWRILCPKTASPQIPKTALAQRCGSTLEFSSVCFCTFAGGTSAYMLMYFFSDVCCSLESFFKGRQICDSKAVVWALPMTSCASATSFSSLFLAAPKLDKLCVVDLNRLNGGKRHLVVSVSHQRHVKMRSLTQKMLMQCGGDITAIMTTRFGNFRNTMHIALWLGAARGRRRDSIKGHTKTQQKAFYLLDRLLRHIGQAWGRQAQHTFSACESRHNVGDSQELGMQERAKFGALLHV